MFDYKTESSHIVTATKELVDWLLSMNTHNRNVNKAHVTLLTNHIKNNNWFLTNQGVGISKTGVLTDGQHRLVALKLADYPPVKILVVTGLDERAQSVVDTHAKRKQVDVIKLLLNKTVSQSAVSALNVRLKMRTDGIKFSLKSGVTDTFELVEELENKSYLLQQLFSVCGTGLRAAIMAALIEYAERYSLDYACDLGKQIKDGVNLEKDDPAYRVRSWIEQNSKQVNGGGQGQVLAYSVLVSACIAHAKGEKLQLLRPASSWARLPKPPQIY